MEHIGRLPWSKFCLKIDQILGNESVISKINPADYLSATIGEHTLKDILNELKKPSNKSLNNIRQIIADADVSDYEDLYRFLYDKLNEYSKYIFGVILHSSYKILKNFQQ